eukprot:SAG31_NODE_535_length_14348_cov_11.339603_11_plen_145_part_00
MRESERVRNKQRTRRHRHSGHLLAPPPRPPRRCRRSLRACAPSAPSDLAKGCGTAACCPRAASALAVKGGRSRPWARLAGPMAAWPCVCSSPPGRLMRSTAHGRVGPAQARAVGAVFESEIYCWGAVLSGYENDGCIAFSMNEI